MEFDSCELTDDIILSGISYATKLYRGMYPKMPEAETLAESFLTKFPSVNPLSAHAILSSGSILNAFLEWSHECRILAIQQHNVPLESVALFSALCRYGEWEDSKSIMTDCSSSASSCPDSDNCHFDVPSEIKRQKHIHSSQNIKIKGDEMWQFEALNQFNGVNKSPRLFKQNDCWRSTDPGYLTS